MRLTTLTLPLAFLGVAACTGKVPTNDDPDASTQPDASEAPLRVNVSGTTLDYFAPDPTPLPATALDIEGVTPPVTNTSDGAGLYTFELEPGSSAYVIATRPAFRPTRNVPVVTDGEMPIVTDMYAGSAQETLNLYNLAGGGTVDVVSGTAVVIADLKRNNGMPLETATLADISLVDNAVPPAPVLGIDGPYFFDINGQLDPALLTAPIGLPSVRVGILNCPVAPIGVSYNLLVNYLNDQGMPMTFTVPIMCDNTGLTLARTGGMGGGGGGGGGGGMGVPNPQFARDVYPRLQRPAVDPLGRACASCHNNARLAPTGPTCIANPATCVPWSAETPAADLLALLIARPGVIVPPPDVATSLFLTKPLLELTPPQNHPNTTFLSTTDPDYIIFMDWISQGALP
jgi:hypothetical protein